MAVILDYARTTATKSQLSWPRRIFPGLTVGVATTIAWIAGVGECVDGPLGNMVGWWVAPAIVLILFSGVYALCYKRSLVFEAFCSALVFSLIGLYGLGLLGIALVSLVGVG